VIDRDSLRQRLAQNLKARMVDGSLLIVLAMLLVLIARSQGGA